MTNLVPRQWRNQHLQGVLHAVQENPKSLLRKIDFLHPIIATVNTGKGSQNGSRFRNPPGLLPTKLLLFCLTGSFTVFKATCSHAIQYSPLPDRGADFYVFTGFANERLPRLDGFDRSLGNDSELCIKGVFLLGKRLCRELPTNRAEDRRCRFAKAQRGGIQVLHESRLR